MIRTCGDEPLGCQHNVDDWIDLCACDRPFCNTFSYLRESTKNAASAYPHAAPFDGGDVGNDAMAPLPRDSADGHNAMAGGRAAYRGLPPPPSPHDAAPIGGGGYLDEDSRVFQRMDGKQTLVAVRNTAPRRRLGPVGEFIDEHGVRRRGKLASFAVAACKMSPPCSATLNAHLASHDAPRHRAIERRPRDGRRNKPQLLLPFVLTDFG